MTTDPQPIRKSDLPTTPPPEFEFFTWFPWPDGDGGDMVRGQRQRGVQVRRLVSYGDWEPVRPDRWADEQPTGVLTLTREQLASLLAHHADDAHTALGDAHDVVMTPQPIPLSWEGRAAHAIGLYTRTAVELEDAQRLLKQARDVARRLLAHSVGFRDVLDDSDRDPWAKTVGADITALWSLLGDPSPAVMTDVTSVCTCTVGEPCGCDSMEPDTDQDALTLTAAERQFLTFALDQAAKEMSLGDGFTDADEAALAKLRRLADGAQPTT